MPINTWDVPNGWENRLWVHIGSMEDDEVEYPEEWSDYDEFEVTNTHFYLQGISQSAITMDALSKEVFGNATVGIQILGIDDDDSNFDHVSYTSFVINILERLRDGRKPPRQWLHPEQKMKIAILYWGEQTDLEE